MSGHAIHFLRRLERASADETDRALSLYRDPQLVTYILKRARLPEDAERIALSLDPQDRGPYVIVTREGRFVTCLGRGMRCDLPLVEHARLEAITARAEGIRERVERAQELTGDPTLGRVFRRLRLAADEASREDLEAALAVQPFMRDRLLLNSLELFDSLTSARPTVLRIRRPGKRDTKLLRSYWESLFYLSALVPLFATGGLDGLEPLRKVEGGDQLLYVCWPLFRQDDLVLALRGLWALGRVGRPLLRTLKREFREAESPLRWAHAFLGLAILGARNAKLRTEILKVLCKLHPTNLWVQHYVASLPDSWPKLAVASVMDPDRLYRIHGEYCRKELYEHAERYEYPPPFRWDSPEDVPEGLANTYSANRPGEFIAEPAVLLALVMKIPWLARCEAQDLFLPRAYNEALGEKWGHWQPGDTLEMVRRLRDIYGVGEPERRTRRKVGRNEPCPCGSGEKYKRCCLPAGRDPFADEVEDEGADWGE